MQDTTGNKNIWVTNLSGNLQQDEEIHLYKCKDITRQKHLQGHER